MNVLFSHIDWGPLVYGIVMFLGLWLTFYKIMKRKWLSVFIDVSVFILVFKLHGGTMAGGFSAMVAAMLASLIFPLMLRKK